MTTRVYNPIKKELPTVDKIDLFLREIVDWQNGKLKVDATINLGAVNIDLDATGGDNVEVKGRDSLNNLRSLLTSSNGKLIVQTNGDNGLQLTHFTNSAIPANPATVTETLTNPVSLQIYNSGSVDVEISFDAGTHWFLLKKSASFSAEANNTTVMIRSVAGLAEIRGLYISRVS